MTLSIFLGIVRAVLAIAGGGLIANGTVSADQWQQVGGAIASLITIGWSAYCHFKDGKNLVAAINAAPPPTTILTPAEAKAVVQGATK